VARGKYRNARQEDDYFLNDSDLEGRYIDGLTFDGGGNGRAGTPDVDDADGDDVEEADAEGHGYTADAEDFDDAGDEEDGDEYDGSDAGAGDPKPSIRLRLAKAIAPKPPAPRTPLAQRLPRTPAQRPASNRQERPAAKPRQAAKQVVVPEGRTIEDMINNLDTRERVIPLVVTVFGIAIVVVEAIVIAHTKSTPKTPELNPAIVASIAGVPAVLTGIAVFIGRRALVGFLALLTGFAMLTIVNPIVGAVYFGLGLWLIMKAQRYTRFAREQSGDVRPGREPRPRAGAATSGSRPASKGRTAATPAAKGPVASKRYTPPRGSQPTSRRARSR
jgi:hypothetical protein